MQEEPQAPEAEETPLEQYMRAGDLPEGFKVVPQVPAGDTPSTSKLEPIDAPTPTVSSKLTLYLTLIKPVL